MATVTNYTSGSVAKVSAFYAGVTLVNSSYGVKPNDFFLIFDSAAAINVVLPLAKGTGRIIGMRCVNHPGVNHNLGCQGADTVNGAGALVVGNATAAIIMDTAVGIWFQINS